ncbi:hypothetical protein DVJ83_17730 (plasmid) [Deinococcus wulumuqiensis]|uniref:ParB-like N-terminal domain-containing protein n=1 Tax=Deinococcus wulumuqiensis TaxID=980427 RepID=A0A345IMM2_9DEIO|nr:ParB N-terminal domain-containing protein [Deinococcus wulumuqiensis]AXH00945.1 hypothetical protein DVJ83_17730 [Deinococcus wulumuqiensis]
MTQTQVPLLTVTVPDGMDAFIALDDLQENAHGATNKLKATMRAVGQRQPVILEDLGGTYRIRDGNRRIAAARALGWNDIHALVYPPLDAAQWALVIAGLHNRASNPIEEARLFRELGKTLTEEGISANTGHPVQVIRARLSLLSLPDDVLECVGSKTLALSIAERAAKLQGTFLTRAVAEIRKKAQVQEPFTASDLKEITVVRQGLLASKLMSAAPPAPALIPPAEVLAAEVRDLCERRGVDLQALLRELTPARIAPVHPASDVARAGVN